ncbi:hypothetical protein PHYBOEH_001767 [Phytophthora boehmeriae]|uniref:Leucine-rich repeat and coiled-coil domain-containing protein 1 n=1 Tax=Phytophthora boehmeriae TaxID=109152 RepID=A0A8T1X6Q7_9STRA|nr:hypothetical protein PHYBOEH_001767 [Phytophthora boehmeriae]
MDAPPPPDDDDVSLVHGPIVISQVNCGLNFIDDLANDDGSDELVEQMNLHGNNIQTMDGLESFTGLVELCLSSNFIEEIAFHALQPLIHLRVLDLSANSIQSTLGFPQLPMLEELSMAHNCLQCLEGLTRPVKFPKLRYMDLRGNEFAEFNDVISLQRLKVVRLSHLRLQAADGGQANPICDRDNYQHVIIKMLPKLVLLDEEEVEFLKEMGSLHMPKYRSLMRQIVENKHTELQPGKNLHGEKTGPGTPVQRRLREEHTFHKQSPRIKTATRRSYPIQKDHALKVTGKGDVDILSPHNSPPPPPPPPPIVSETDLSKPYTTYRVILKDCSTNTEVDLEKDILRREQIMTQRETEILEKEKKFLAKENEFFIREKDFRTQIADLQEELKDTQSRAEKAEAAVLEMTNHLLQKEKDQAAVAASSSELASVIQQSQDERQVEWNATLEALKLYHQQEVEALDLQKRELESKRAALESDSAITSRKLGEAEDSLRKKSIEFETWISKFAETSKELELERKTHDALATQLSSEVKYHKDRVEQAEKRNTQLEMQVTELKTNVEAVYNKCIEKDEAVQQLKKGLVARQDELDALRMQHVKDSERQDKLQTQQQDLYERQLQASIVQIEMEFRKEHQQSAQKLKTLQRKNQDCLKELSRVREAYKVSVQREATVKAEIKKIQAIMADDKKKLYAEDTKRSDVFKAKLRAEKEKSRALVEQLADEQKKLAQGAMLSAELDEKKAENDQLRHEAQQFEDQRGEWKKLEDDLRAALKVKDIMLADQQRQIKEIQRDRRQTEEQFNDEIAELQTQVEDLEAALDENLQKCTEEEVKNEKLSVKIDSLEQDAPEKEKQLSVLREELEHKVSALEFLDQEMQRMRGALENQDGLFQKRIQKHIEQHREEIERVRAGAEEEREHQLLEWETERNEMMRKYEVLASEMKDIASQNTKLRLTVDQERRKNAQNDRDMRIMLAQIDRERQVKKENLRQIKSLFEQLQREES